MKDFYPTKVLKIYKQPNESNYYIESHNVIHRNNKRFLGPGMPLKKNVMQKLINATLSDNEQSYFKPGLFNDRILAVEPVMHRRFILWYDKAKQHYLTIKHRNLKDGMYSFPALLYFVQNNEFRVFAMKSGLKKPTLNTMLYQAPLFNTVSENGICWGNVQNKTHDMYVIDDEIAAWDIYLWNSIFSENGGGSARRNLVDIYKETYKGKNRFPVKDLIPANMTISSMLNKYIL